MIHVPMRVVLRRRREKRLLGRLSRLDRLRGLCLSGLGRLKQLLRLHRAQKLLAGRAVAEKVRQRGGTQTQSRRQAGTCWNCRADTENEISA